MTSPQLADTKLFEPIKVGNTQLKHRIALAPLTRYRNDDDHVAQPFMERYYAERASEPGTLVIAEATAISHAEEGAPNDPGFVSDAQVEAWRKVIAAVHAKGSYFFHQLWAMGRAANPKTLAERGYEYRSSSAVPYKDNTPRAMTEAEILQTIDDFVAAAKRAVSAGADGVEIHGAHGYLLDQFLTAGINQRTDRWGGSIENRARLLIETVRAVVGAVGGAKVGLRLSPFAGFQGAEKNDIVELYSYIVQELKKIDSPLAYLSLVEAKGDPVTIFGGEAANQGKTLDFILEAWGNRSPVIVAGGYKPETAAQALENHYKQWDVIVAFGRHFLANPDLVYRIKNGIPLNEYNRSTFYINKSEVGYNDYAFSDEYVKEHPEAARL